MLRSSRAYVFYKRDVLQNVAKFTEKHVWRSLFLKMLSLQLYLKRLWRRYFPGNFSKLLRATFLQNTSRLVLLNADDWKNPRDCWSKLSLFSPLRFLIFNDSIITALSGDVKTLSSSFLLKSERFHQSSQKFLLCYQCFSCLIIVGKVVNLLLTFVICMIFFHVLFKLFWPWLSF